MLLRLSDRRNPQRDNSVCIPTQLNQRGKKSTPWLGGRDLGRKCVAGWGSGNDMRIGFSSNPKDDPHRKESKSQRATEASYFQLSVTLGGSPANEALASCSCREHCSNIAFSSTGGGDALCPREWNHMYGQEIPTPDYLGPHALRWNCFAWASVPRLTYSIFKIRAQVRFCFLPAQLQDFQQEEKVPQELMKQWRSRASLCRLRKDQSPVVRIWVMSERTAKRCVWNDSSLILLALVKCFSILANQNKLPASLDEESA
ncbi:hypothetical protein R3P38DRAFT_3369361 [Favolaschia claudopus]|uniref:Uncharacterized protein n=1 Tax=Favolaschia claudopus TaxID=2862362 RepID=A0AAW0A2D0_9AGAR